MQTLPQSHHNQDDISAIEKRFLGAVEKMHSQGNGSIKTEDQYLLYNSRLRELRAMDKEVKEYFDPDIKRANEIHKSLTGKKKRICDAIAELGKSIKRAVIEWDERIERKRIEAERAAEAKRLEEERKQREKIEAQAAKAREEGKEEKAEALEEKAENVVVTPKFTPPPMQKVKGNVVKVSWKGEVTDVKAFCQSVVDGRIPETAVSVNSTVLNKLAVAFKDTVQIPGVRFRAEKSLSIR